MSISADSKIMNIIRRCAPEHRSLPMIGGISDFGKKRFPIGKSEGGFINKVADLYFSPKSFEQSCVLHEMLGVRITKKVVLGTWGAILKKMAEIKGDDDFCGKYFIGENRTLESLAEFEKETRFNETAHIIPALCNAFSFLLLSSIGGDNLGIFFGTLGLLNFSLIVLQRYNRARIYNTINESNRIYAEKYKAKHKIRHGNK
jgi:hypothetical protein